MLKTFFLVHLLPRGSLASNQRCHYPCWGLLIRDTRLCSWQKKETCATLSKAVNVLSHNSQARDLGVCLCGKALAGLGGTSIISACLPGVACVEITAPINKQSPSVEIFIQTELHPCGGLVWALFLHLKGLFRKPYMGKSTPWNQWGATHWLSAECYKSPLIYCQYMGRKQRRKRNSPLRCTWISVITTLAFLALKQNQVFKWNKLVHERHMYQCQRGNCRVFSWQ